MTSKATTTPTNLPSPTTSCCNYNCTTSFLLKYHLPLGLAVGLLFGYALPTPGVWWSSIIVKNDWIKMSNINVFLIFLISGLKLKTNDIKKAFESWKSVLYGSAIILVLTPLLSFGLINIPFQTPELAYGLAVFFLGPTTISSGVILTGQAKGNIALALMLTVLTNLLAIFTMPLLVSLVFSSLEGITVAIDAGSLLLKLMLYILLPLLLGKMIGYVCACTQVCTKRFKIPLKLFSSFLLVMVPWMSVSKSADKFSTMTAGEVFALFGIGIAVHIVYLAVNYNLFRRCCMLPLAERKAVVIMGSQKTLPVALSVISFLPELLGSQGLMGLPCIISHFVQIVMDGVVAAKWAEYVDEKEDDPLVDTQDVAIIKEKKLNMPKESEKKSSKEEEEKDVSVDVKLIEMTE